ncbi:MAG: hypothetical protein H7X80_03550 [bacterium]|nr:hypothetical protein [Candidatus Kapabacteria bacterium]
MHSLLSLTVGLNCRRHTTVRFIRAIVFVACTFSSIAIEAQTNHAIRFDGVDAWLDLGSRSSFDFRTSFTLEAWIRPTAFNDTVGIVGNYRRDQLGGSGHGLVLGSSGRLGMVLAHDIGLTDFVWTAEPVELNTWTHVAGTWNGHTMRLFVNGIEVAAAGVNGVGVLWTVENSMAVARYLANDNGYFSGTIDEVRMWSVCRSANELRSTQHLRLGSGDAGQVSYLHLDDANGSTTTDDAIAGRFATLRGACTWVKSDVTVGVGRTAQSAPGEPMRMHYFNGTDVRVEYSAPTLGRPLTITSLLDVDTDSLPPGVARVAPRVWMIRPGDDAFTANLTFNLGRGAIGELDAATLDNLQLYYRPANEADAWIRAASIVTAEVNAGSVTFGPIVAGPNGIGAEGGRFVIGTSGDSRLESPHALTIANNLVDVRTCAGELIRLSVLADGRNLSYQWRKDGREMTTAIGPVLDLGRVTLEDQGAYQLTITDQHGEIATTQSAMHVVVRPRVLADPTDVHVIEGQTLELHAELDGTDIAYQWQKNRVDIPGAISYSIVFSPVDSGTAGYYRLFVRNECGEENTVDVKVTVTMKPKPLSVEDDRASARISIIASPNPARDIVSIRVIGVDAADEYSFALVDSRGAIVAAPLTMTSSRGRLDALLDASSLPAGAYLIRVARFGTIVGSEKIVVDK